MKYIALLEDGSYKTIKEKKLKKFKKENIVSHWMIPIGKSSDKTRYIFVDDDRCLIDFDYINIKHDMYLFSGGDISGITCTYFSSDDNIFNTSSEFYTFMHSLSYFEYLSDDIYDNTDRLHEPLFLTTPYIEIDIYKNDKIIKSVNVNMKFLYDEFYENQSKISIEDFYSEIKMYLFESLSDIYPSGYELFVDGNKKFNSISFDGSRWEFVKVDHEYHSEHRGSDIFYARMLLDFSMCLMHNDEYADMFDFFCEAFSKNIIFDFYIVIPTYYNYKTSNIDIEWDKETNFYKYSPLHFNEDDIDTFREDMLYESFRIHAHGYDTEMFILTLVLSSYNLIHSLKIISTALYQISMNKESLDEVYVYFVIKNYPQEIILYEMNELNCNDAYSRLMENINKYKELYGGK